MFGGSSSDEYTGDQCRRSRKGVHTLVEEESKHLPEDKEKANTNLS